MGVFHLRKCAMHERGLYYGALRSIPGAVGEWLSINYRVQSTCLNMFLPTEVSQKFAEIKSSAGQESR